MFSIGQVAKLTGITSFTLRYYEKIGLLPSPARANGQPDGVRQYDDADLRFIRFIHGLKMTGMKLEDIAAFTEDGCLLSQWETKLETSAILRKRIEILDRHTEQLEHQIRRLEAVMAAAQEKRKFYTELLEQR